MEVFCNYFNFVFVFFKIWELDDVEGVFRFFIGGFFREFVDFVVFNVVFVFVVYDGVEIFYIKVVLSCEVCYEVGVWFGVVWLKVGYLNYWFFGVCISVNNELGDILWNCDV